MYRIPACAFPRRGHILLYVSLAQLRGPRGSYTGVSLWHHVTAQHQSHWFHCLQTCSPLVPGYSAACGIARWIEQNGRQRVNQCRSVNTATFTWHPPVFAPPPTPTAATDTEQVDLCLGKKCLKVLDGAARAAEKGFLRVGHDCLHAIFQSTNWYGYLSRVHSYKSIRMGANKGWPAR